MVDTELLEDLLEVGLIGSGKIAMMMMIMVMVMVMFFGRHGVRKDAGTKVCVGIRLADADVGRMSVALVCRQNSGVMQARDLNLSF